MILTEQKPFPEILEILKGSEKIAIIGCGGCATIARTGGERQVDELAEKLKNEGKEIKYKFVVDAGVCYTTESKKILVKIDEVDAAIVLSCGSGVQAISGMISELNFDFHAFPGLNSKHEGIGPVKGVIYEKCVGCGECILHLTGGICPVTLCPKNKVNGPCGDEVEGKCEASPDERECVWALIYEKLKKENNLEFLDKLYDLEEKDWSKERLEKIDLMEKRRNKYKKTIDEKRTYGLGNGDSELASPNH